MLSFGAATMTAFLALKHTIYKTDVYAAISYIDLYTQCRFAMAYVIFYKSGARHHFCFYSIFYPIVFFTYHLDAAVP